MSRIRSETVESRMPKKDFFGKTGNIIFPVIIAVPVFFLFAYLLTRAGYYVFDYNSRDILPAFPIYLADFSLCFSSRLLIGSVTKLFTYQLTLSQLYNICCTMNIIALGTEAIFFGVIIYGGIKRKSYFMLCVSALLLINPVIPQEFYPATGTYDTYWIVLFAILLLLFNTYGFEIMCPILCFTGMMVHYGFMFSFLPAIAALLIYDFFTSEEKKKKILSLCSFVLTTVSSVFVIVYSFFFSKNHLTMTQEEFHNYLVSRLKLLGIEEIRLKERFGDSLFPFRFFEIYFFNDERIAGDSSAITPKEYLELFFGYLFDSTNLEYYLEYALIIIPFMIIFAVFWIMCSKKVKGIKKLPYICFALIQLVFFAACIFSTDVYRWGGALLISQTALITVMMRKKDKPTQEVLKSPLLNNRKTVICLIVIGIIYAVFLLKAGVYLPRTNDV